MSISVTLRHAFRHLMTSGGHFLGAFVLAAVFPGVIAMGFAANPSVLPDCPTGAHATGKSPPAGLEWRCDNASDVPEGPWLTWYADGTLMSERHMKNGREHGRQRSWWPNGQLMMEGVSVDGNRYKGFKYWGVDGTPSNIDIKTEVIEHKLNQ